MLTSYADEEALFEAIAAGASGYVLKRIGSDELVCAIRAVAPVAVAARPGRHGRACSSGCADAAHAEESSAFSELTEQERRVLAHLAVGESNREIAAAHAAGGEDGAQLRQQHPGEARRLPVACPGRHLRDQQPPPTEPRAGPAASRADARRGASAAGAAGAGRAPAACSSPSPPPERVTPRIPQPWPRRRPPPAHSASPSTSEPTATPEPPAVARPARRATTRARSAVRSTPEVAGRRQWSRSW